MTLVGHVIRCDIDIGTHFCLFALLHLFDHPAQTQTRLPLAVQYPLLVDAKASS